MGKDEKNVKNLLLDELDAVNGGFADEVSCNSSVIEELIKKDSDLNGRPKQNADLLAAPLQNVQDLIPEKSFSGGLLDRG